jgi:gliding motility-associated-like protein
MQKRLLLTSFLICILSILDASHYMGADITYECLGGCNYRIYHYTYYDCNGGATTPPPGPPPTPSITLVGAPSGCTPANPPSTSGWVFISYQEVTPVCPTAVTGCTTPGALINGVLGGGFYSDYNLCNTGCTSYTIQWQTCCRNYAITSPASGGGIALNATTIDLSVSPCNSSPVFANPPIPYICAGQAFTFNQGAYDPDGDSIVYSLGPCYDSNPGTQVGYGSGYTATSPLGSTWLVTIDPNTGDVTFMPNPGGAIVTAVMCIYVTEFRNGVQIGQISRDMQITVLPCTITPPQTTGIINYQVNGVNGQPLTFNTAQACANVPVCFDIGVISPTPLPNPPLNYTMYWNNGISNGVFYNINNPAQQDTLYGTTTAPPTAHICFTPSAPGNYQFVLTVADDNCPIQGLNQYTVTISVNNSAANANAVAAYVSCNQVQFTAMPSATSQGPFDYTWIGTGSLNNNVDSQFVYTYPNIGPQTWQCTIQDTFGCTATIQGAINIPSGAVANAGADFVICSGYAAQLGGPPVTGQTYNWTPNVPGLSTTTSSSPTLTYTNNTGAPIQLVLTQTATAGLCNTVDQVTATILPAPLVSISPPNPTICLGDSILLVASGGTNYLWNTGQSNDSIWVSPAVTTPYSVVSFLNGCSSPPVFKTVTVTPGPVGNISGTFSVCAGASTTLTANGGTNYSWSTTAQTSSITFNNLGINTPVWMVPFSGQCRGDTIYGSIIVNPNPVANFSSDKVCEKNPTQFTDLSSISSGNIIGWQWNFGDNTSNTNTSFAQSPTHIYTQSGNFNAILTVISENGCTNTVVYPVEVAAIPNVAFSFSDVCFGTAANFTNLTTINPGNNINTFYWDFGDNSNPYNTTTASPGATYAYNQYGYYNVNLLATSDNGCTSDFSKTIFIHPKPVSAFTANPVCRVDSLPFILNATVSGSLDDVTNTYWDFGDFASGISNFDTRFDPKHLYPAFGNYNVQLIVQTNHGCRDTIVKPIEIYPQPVAYFEVQKRCANEVAEFSDLSSVNPSGAVTGWNWTFSTPQGNVNSFTQNPTFDFATAGPGIYNVTLIANTAVNCKDTVTRPITVNPVPVPDFSYTRVCLGDTTRYTNLTTILTGSMSEYNWVLQENPLITSNANEPKWVYATDGIRVVELMAKSDSGCVHLIKKPVYVNALPQLPNIYSDTVCLGQSAVLSVEPMALNDQVKWFEDVNGNNTLHTGNSYVTPHMPNSDVYYVQVTTPLGCKSSLYPVSVTLFSEEDVDMLMSSNVIELPSAPITFGTNTTIPLVAWNWDFGDGTTSMLSNPVHEFIAPDIFTVKLVSIDEHGCRYEQERMIEVKRVVTVSPPSAFSPNGDGYNDYYSVGYYNVRTFNIQVYDRWGGMVYESNQPDFKWDGKDKSGKDLPEGTYVFVIKALAYDNNREDKTGTITIVR